MFFVLKFDMMVMLFVSLLFSMFFSMLCVLVLWNRWLSWIVLDLLKWGLVLIWLIVCMRVFLMFDIMLFGLDG